MLHVIPTAPDDSGEEFTYYGFQAIRPALHVNVRTIQESIRHGRQTTVSGCASRRSDRRDYSAVYAGNTTDWLANTYGTLAAHVGNVARAMWVAPEGVIYTASMWDEDEGGVAIYQNGKSVGSIGTHSGSRAARSPVTRRRCSSRCSPAKHTAAAVGRYNRATKYRDLVIQVSAATNQPRIDVVTEPRRPARCSTRERLRQSRARIHHRRRVAAGHQRIGAGCARGGWRGQRVGRAEERGRDRRLQPGRCAAEHDPDAGRVAAVGAGFRCGGRPVAGGRRRPRPEHQALYSVGPARAGRHVRRARRLSRHDDGHQGAGRCAALHAHRRAGRTPAAISTCSTIHGAAAGISAATARPTFTRTAAPAACGGRCSR